MKSKIPLLKKRPWRTAKDNGLLIDAVMRTYKAGVLVIVVQKLRQKFLILALCTGAQDGAVCAGRVLSARTLETANCCTLQHAAHTLPKHFDNL
ncbi:MAG: hypothetical protein ACNI3A_06935 [Desulfovibrio sp.]|uniref:hypothetical protein n=1 Tax=Desulfovibrio sp. 7SRBS1 TaxID=3378064 RepID=UPI003B3C8E70